MLQKCDEKSPSLEFFYEGDLPHSNFQKLTPLIKSHTSIEIVAHLKKITGAIEMEY